MILLVGNLILTIMNSTKKNHPWEVQKDSLEISKKPASSNIKLQHEGPCSRSKRQYNRIILCGAIPSARACHRYDPPPGRSPLIEKNRKTFERSQKIFTLSRQKVYWGERHHFHCHVASKLGSAQGKSRHKIE